MGMLAKYFPRIHFSDDVREHVEPPIRKMDAELRELRRINQIMLTTLNAIMEQTQAGIKEPDSNALLQMRLLSIEDMTAMALEEVKR